MKKLYFWLSIIMVLTLFAGTAAPALARVKGEPDLQVMVIGSGEFPVGQTGALQIMLQNNGTFSGGTEDPDDQVMALGYTSALGVTLAPPCTTAISVTAALKSTSPSIEVLSGPTAVGTLPRGMTTAQPVTFQLQVAEDAQPGTYSLQVELKYQYLQNVNWLNPIQLVPAGVTSSTYQPEFAFYWGNKEQQAEIPITVVGTYFSVAVTHTEGVRVGTTGVITLNIQNSGGDQADEVTAEVVPGVNFSPLGPASFLGDIPGGSSVTTQFKVSVSPEAIAKDCPLDILIKYKDGKNIPRQLPLTVGIPVAEEVKFELQPTQVDGGNLTPGAEKIIEIPVVNASDYEVKDATARINIVDPFSTAPFSTTDDTAYIGTLQPGESGTAKFRITVDTDAVAKTYTLEVEVKYWDSLDNSYISQPMRAVVTVQPSSGLSVTTIIILSLVALAIIGIIFYLIRRGRKAA
jgi:hypothetical protein